MKPAKTYDFKDLKRVTLLGVECVEVPVLAVQQAVMDNYCELCPADDADPSLALCHTCEPDIFRVPLTWVPILVMRGVKING